VDRGFEQFLAKIGHTNELDNLLCMVDGVLAEHFEVSGLVDQLTEVTDPVFISDSKEFHFTVLFGDMFRAGVEDVRETQDLVFIGGEVYTIGCEVF
jgi:hypothetical protein